MSLLFFFFFKQKTAYEMRISDWSSDVCSSDLTYSLIDYHESGAAGDRIFTGKITHKGGERSISGRGNGLISSVLAALRDELGVDLEVADYSEHAIGAGTDVAAAAYVERTEERRVGKEGVGTCISRWSRCH